jgi:predicted glycosyltransferase
MDPEETLAGSKLAETWMGIKKRKLRIALYSHDTVGIGHMRRNLSIAQVFARSLGEPLILLITGGREVCAFGLPPGTDCLTLPALTKEENGQYRARRWDMSLKELLDLRSRSIASSLRAFAPDVLIVDKVPRGAEGELELGLRELHEQGGTKLVLGLRDVLDAPETVRQEWKKTGAEEAIRQFYDAIWIYGDHRVFDPVAEYHFSSPVAAKVTYTGYLARRESANVAAVEEAGVFPAIGEVQAGASLGTVGPRAGRTHQDDLILCLVGGGQDGSHLAETFAETDFPSGTIGVILTGPFMPPQVQNRLIRQAQKNRQLRVLGFVTDSDLLLRQASRVIAMGGYNTTCEILASKKPALIIPRVSPRQEQLIRAERLQGLGLLEMLHPKNLNTRALRKWCHSSPANLNKNLTGSGVGSRSAIDLEGFRRLPRLLDRLLAAPDRCSPRNPSERSNHYACS